MKFFQNLFGKKQPPASRLHRRILTMRGYAKGLDETYTVTSVRVGYEKSRDMQEVKSVTKSGDDLTVYDPSDEFVRLVKAFGDEQDRIVLCIDFQWEISPGNVTTGSNISISKGAQDRDKQVMQ